MKTKWMIYCCCLMQMMAASVMYSQDTTKTIEEINMADEIDLEQLMNVKLTVASHKELSMKETPAVVTVLTKEDIDHAAFRDITGWLRSVPGLEFGQDVNGEAGLGVRGLWGHEGRVLVMLDGMQLNENMYGTTQWLNTIDIDQVEKIEIIRGSGYAVYNGLAGLAVINIITKKAENLQGIEVHGTYGQLTNSFARQLLSTQAGYKKGNWNVKAAVFAGIAQRHQGEYKDLNDTSIILNKDGNDVSYPLNANFHLEFKGIEFKYLHQDNKNRVPVILGNILQRPTRSDFSTRQADLKYTWKVIKKLNIKPHVNYNYNRPWNSGNLADTTDAEFFAYDRNIQRITGDLTENFMITNSIHLNATHGFYQDYAKGNQQPNYEPWLIGEKNKAVYFDWFNALELFIHQSWYTLSLGMRQENHSVFGNVFLPRIAGTGYYKKVNLKASYGQAFRAPLVENLIANKELKPEVITTQEIQLGYEFSSNVYTSINFYHSEIKNTIVYSSQGGVDNYFNKTKMGTQGIELETHVQENWVKLSATWSYYVNNKQDSSQVSFYWAKNKKQLIGFAANKATFSSVMECTKNITFSASLVAVGERYAYNTTDTAGVMMQQLMQPNFIANLSLCVHSLNKIKGFSMAFGFYDVLNSGYAYIQPYDGGHRPMQAPGRELMIKLSYNWNKEKFKE